MTLFRLLPGFALVVAFAAVTTAGCDSTPVAKGRSGGAGSGAGGAAGAPAGMGAGGLDASAGGGPGNGGAAGIGDGSAGGSAGAGGASEGGHGGGSGTGDVGGSTGTLGSGGAIGIPGTATFCGSVTTGDIDRMEIIKYDPVSKRCSTLVLEVPGSTASSKYMVSLPPNWGLTFAGVSEAGDGRCKVGPAISNVDGKITSSTGVEAGPLDVDVYLRFFPEMGGYTETFTVKGLTLPTKCSF